MFSRLQEGFFDKGRPGRCTFCPIKGELACQAPRKLKSSILVSCVLLSKICCVFCLSALVHTKIKAGRRIDDCGHVSVTTARSARSTNCEYKTTGKTKQESKIVFSRCVT